MPNDHHWDACPTGELSKLTARLTGRQQRRFFLRTVAAASGVSALAGIGALGVWRLGSGVVANIDCVTCKKLMPDYAAERLNRDERHVVMKHLAACPPCQAFYAKHFRAEGQT